MKQYYSIKTHDQKYVDQKKFYTPYKFGAALAIIANVEFKITPIICLVPLPKRNIDVTFNGASSPSFRRNGPIKISL